VISSEPVKVVLELAHDERTISGRIAVDDTPAATSTDGSS
jgi:hypothetical protein